MGEGAERIVRRIFADAEEKAKAIKDEAARKAASIESAAQQKAEQKRDQILEQARKEAEEQKRRIIGVAQLEARKDLLSAKQDMIGEAFQQSLEQLAGMDDQAYLAVIRKMLLQVVENGTETVAFSARDLKRVTENFMQEVNTTLAESGKKR